MKRISGIVITCILFLASVSLLCACDQKAEKTRVRVLIVPKFEIGEMSGDDSGEAQLFYEHYCADCGEIDIPNSTPTSRFYLNGENGVGLLVTGSGKTAAGLSLMSLLSWDEYDFSDTLILSVGCGGGSTGSSVFGDVVLVTAVCDFELGHHTDRSELDNPDEGNTWFPLDSLRDYSIELFNPELYDKAYTMIRDCPLRTTEATRRVLASNYPDEEWAAREPLVMKGTAVTGDSYWKGTEDHENAGFIAEYYECPDQYAVTEMEEIGIMNAAECFGLKDRVISLRVIVNMDTFLRGESPEMLWLGGTSFSSKVTEENSETVDIFEPGMENLFDAGRIVIDAALNGEL
ncbi:MAG: hypothetical protein II640_11560 [Lachnospiraceae bacterium]|nr:hypothetical protein [Lachnospiraceae bacterium]